MTARLPEPFVWTKIGAEAGETVARILKRKEEERLANHGLFLWGVGNSVAPGLRALILHTPVPRVIFAAMIAAAKSIDSAPAATVRWSKAQDLEGVPWELPPGSVVTSRASAAGGVPKTFHFALVCRCEKPLALLIFETPYALAHLRNFLGDTRVGASQVTAVVRHLPHLEGAGALYRRGFSAQLAAPYFIRLSAPQIIL